jgi:hypothetical protein
MRAARCQPGLVGAVLAVCAMTSALAVGLATPEHASAQYGPAPFSNGVVTSPLTVRTRTDPSCCSVGGGPAVGDEVPVFCYRDGRTATYRGRTSQRWFLIQYHQTATHAPIGFISVLAFANQPRVSRCVHNTSWPEKWASSSTLSPPATEYVVPLCGQLLGPQPGTPEWNEYCTDPGPTDGGGTSGGGGSGAPSPPPPPPTTYLETAGGVAHTWTNYTNAGGTQGPSVGAQQTIQIACKLQGFRVADGNTWWYRIASNPWNNQYYVSADAFYNNGQRSGTLRGTPFVDGNVRDC